VKETIRSLQKNDLAKDSELIIISDGPRSDKDMESVFSVREYIKTVSGFKDVSVVERENNLGLAQSIISGVTEFANRHGRVIVLEDDMISSPYFLKFMNDGLEYYEDEENVISIHGYSFPVQGRLPETFFLKGAECWGWATWKRGWDLFESDGKKLLAEILRRKVGTEFDFNGAYPYVKMLEDQTKGKNDSWAIRWSASAFLKDRLTLHPGRSLIRNIGTDESGTHCGKTDRYDVDVSREPVIVSGIPIEENWMARKEIERYLRTLNPGFTAWARDRINRILH
jgi:hypothetical protein